jgi:flavin-dependent dehydrogenase
MAAYELARRSLRVLLVDKSDFPRPKVCGCCLNGQALAVLKSRGLGHVISAGRAVGLRHVMIAAARNRAIVPLPEGVALSREALDMGLINSAMEKGASFLPRVRASLNGMSLSGRQVTFKSNEREVEATADVVLVADGLAGTVLASHLSKCQEHGRRNPWVPEAERSEASGLDDMPSLRGLSLGHPRTQKPSLGASFSRAKTSSSEKENSRIGAAVIVEHGPAFYGPETIYMACGRGGYVGLVRLEDGRLNVAAAFDPDGVRSEGSPGRLALKILDEAGLPSVPDVLQAAWKGTPPITRHTRRLAAERLFVLGDAASFVEPFTGEGIAWALQSGVAVAPLAAQAVGTWKPALEKEWTVAYYQQVERRQLICRLTAATLRHPGWTALAVRLLALFPFLGRPVLHQLNSRHSFRKGMSL